MLKKLCRNKKGQALVEFALILPLLLLLIFGILEFGRIFSTSLIVHNSAREGARAGVTGASDSQIITAIQSSTPVLSASLLDITITPSESLRSRGQDLQVRVSYPISIMTPFISAITGEIVNVEAASIMRVE